MTLLMGRGEPGESPALTGQEPVRPLIYRIIKSAERTMRDFESDQERKKKPRDDSPEMLRRHTGRSVWLTEDSAHAHARELPWLGRYLAEVKLRPG